MEPAFNEKSSLEALAKLQAHQQLAFAAACCERLLPSYATFQREASWGDLGPLRRALDAVWDACAGSPPAPSGVRALTADCEACAPDSDDFTFLHTAAAQDAVFAICALLDFLLDGEVAHLATPPRFATDTVDLIVQENEDIDPADPRLEQRTLEHALMQQELVRQRRDLAEAAQLARGDAAALGTFRARAQSEAALVPAP